MSEKWNVSITPEALTIEIPLWTNTLQDALIEEIRAMHLNKTLPEKILVLKLKGFSGNGRQFAAMISYKIGRAFVVQAEFNEEKKKYVVTNSFMEKLPDGTPSTIDSELPD